MREQWRTLYNRLFHYWLKVTIIYLCYVFLHFILQYLTKILISVGSWFISPLLSGITSITLLFFIKRCILLKEDPLEAGLTALPLFYSFTILVNVFSIVHDGPKLLYMDKIPVWMAAAISGVVALVCLIVIRVIVVPWQRRKILAELKAEHPPVNFNIGESAG